MEFLQYYWWGIISLLGGILVFLLFVQGGQSMIFSLSRTQDEKTILVNILGRKWEFTFTTLVLFGGAFFASFPLFYSTSFGGAYWMWFAILICFVLQAVSYEYMHKPKNVFGPTVFRVFLVVNGVLGTFLLGVMVASFFTGSEFTVNKSNIADAIISGNKGESMTISAWASAFHGFELLAIIRNWFLGLAVFFLARTQACLYFIKRIKNDETVLIARIRKFLWINAVLFLGTFVTFVVWTLVDAGWAINENGDVVKQAGKYFYNFVETFYVGVVFLIGVLAVLFGLGKTFFCPKFTNGIWFTGIGTILAVTCLLLVAGWNDTAFYPSTIETAPGVYNNSLTIYNASSSYYTLRAMAYVSIFIPVVVGYIFYAWRAITTKKMDVEVIKEDGHMY